MLLAADGFRNEEVGILTRKVVRRGIFKSRDELVQRLMNFIAAYNTEARPFQWTYTGNPLAA